MRRLVLLMLPATALVAAGCGSSSDSQDATNASAPVDAPEQASEAPSGEAAKAGAAATREDAAASAAAKRRRGTKVKVVSSEFGRVIADRKGEALYLFDRETKGKSECYGACARAWPPVLTKGRPRARAGAKAGLLGTTKRRNGKLQVTYNGQPLYYYVHDAPGTILCHDVPEFGGTWLVVKPNGKAAA